MEDLFWIDLEWWGYLLVIFAGVLTGIINTLAGSGSLITLPIFMFLFGFPADVANGTNRIGALMASGIGYRAFKKSDKGKEMEGAFLLIAVTVFGAIFGSLSAANLSAQTINIVIGSLMIFMLSLLLIKPKRWLRETSGDLKRNHNPWVVGLFILIGFYGGFIQAGMGIFLMMGLVLAAQYSLVASTGIKLLIVFLLNIPAICVFFYHNQIHFGAGLLVAVCQSVGAILAVKFISRVPNANKWIYWILIGLVIISSIKFIIEWIS